MTLSGSGRLAEVLCANLRNLSSSFVRRLAQAPLQVLSTIISQPSTLASLSPRGFEWQPDIKLGTIRACREIDFPVMSLDDDSVGDDETKSRA